VPVNPLLTLPSIPADLVRIEDAMHRAVHTSDPGLTEMASHLIVAGGKRIRPVLSAVVALTAHRVASDDIVQGGVSCELVHLGSLYHDDVLDEAEIRRQVSSVNARWGNVRAIVAGDFLLARASVIAASLGAEVAGLLGATIARLCEG
jgi:heptaprenyl diphosphate synthase